VYRVIVGICAYDEEGNIEHLLQNLVSEQHLRERYKILIICSGCTDRTPKMVQKFQEKDAHIELLTENVRKGKSNALNRIFKTARDSAEILVLVNADALPENDSINKLLSKLSDYNVGAVFAQPVPLKNFSGACYGVVRMIWRLHHIISLIETPKLSGELCAIRTTYLDEIPENTATDEPYIERAIWMQNKRISYAPDALVHIRCPANIIDLTKQRKRIWIGHIQLKRSTGYKVSTSSFKNMLRAVAALGLRDILCLLPGGFLEAVACLQARIAVKKGNIPYIWEPIRSTKTSLYPTSKSVSEEESVEERIAGIQD
jgi:cellulose synthase/poly-beta-1,6-N-acetylglucosamine synthase-like glycosyltransferase